MVNKRNKHCARYLACVIRLNLILILCSCSYANAHVPQFVGHQCGVPLHDVDISQAAYFITNPGQVSGVTFPSHDPSTSRALASDDGLIIQVAMRQKYPDVDFKLFAGCLPPHMNISYACSSSSSPHQNNNSLLFSSSPPLGLARQWKSQSVEPFTQSVYHMIIDHKTDTHLGECGREETTGEYAILLYASSEYPILWSAIVGKQETFSFSNLISFPVYMGRIHGKYGNRRYRFGALFALGVLGGFAYYFTSSRTPRGRRASYYALLASCVVFAIVSLDILLHFLDCAHEVDQSETVSALPLFLVLVIGMANVLPAVFAAHLAVQSKLEIPTPLWTSVWARGVSGVLLLAYIASIGGLGDTSLQLATFVFVFLTTFSAILWTKLYSPPNQQLVGLGVIVYASVLLVFLGSGYWIGPILLGIAGGLIMRNA